MTEDPSLESTSSSDLTVVDQQIVRERYEILEEVGRGGMGVVYRARHKLLDRQVAVKLCLAREMTPRLQREARLLAKLRSPHLVLVHDLDQLEDGRTLLVMDWVEGTDLAKLLRTNKQPLASDRAIEWMKQVCSGMQTASEQGVIHRDLKPSNILIDSTDSAKVADFGLAWSQDAKVLTLSGGLMGTPSYMAPEQAEDPRGVDSRTDIYSFGATFYHVLTGEPPFTGETQFSILFKHKTEPLVSPRSRNADLDEQLSDCIERCLAKSPPDRFRTFADVQQSLESMRGESPWDTEDDTEVSRQWKKYTERRLSYITGGLARNEPDPYPLSSGRLVSILAGNLVEQQVDALVSSDDQELSMGGGVSAALSEAAGPTLASEARRFTPVRPGRALVTTAGNLPARFVFHGVTIGFGIESESGIVYPSRDLINEILESCFYHADTLGVESIAFPLLGSGVGRFSPATCLDTMFRSLVRKLTRGVTSVREARIVIYQPSRRWQD